MTTRTFRFGAAVAFTPDGSSWLALAQRIERLGYATMLMPDGLWVPAPFVGLSAAAAATSTLRLGTHVLAAPLHAPAAVAHETATLDLLSDHRFELGLGAGRPQAADEAERLGRPFGGAAERVGQVAETITAVRRQFATSGRPAPRILLAGIAPALVELAAAEADTLALPLPHHVNEDALAAKVAELRALVGSRLDELELATNVLVVGDGDVPEAMRALVRDLPADSFSRLRGTPREIADNLLRRREQLGISYVTIAQHSIEDFAPVVELLAGT